MPQPTACRIARCLLTSGILALTLTAASVAPRGQTQESDQAPAVDARYTEAAIDWISAKLDEIYVFPDVAKQMSEHLRQRYEEGAYEGIAEVDALVRKLTEDLQSISHDKHLHVDPAQQAPLENLTQEERRNREARALERRKFDNFAFQKVERLLGNVGYLKFDAFMDASYAGETAISAMSFLANSDALIIDLQDNGGGSPSMIQLISSYFFEEPKHLNSFYIRKSDETRQFWTSSHVQGRRMAEIPIFVLTSLGTFSAAEEFTYNLQNMKRATIVGQTTGGGAHPVEYHQNAELQIGASIPFGRAVNPISGTNWEGTGVKPDVETEPGQAIQVAHKLAIVRLLETADGPRKNRLEWISGYLSALEHPADASDENLIRFIGQYGPRRIFVENGQVFYQREEATRRQLFQLSGNLFCLEGLENFRIRFDEDDQGNVTAITGVYFGGYEDHSPRDQ